MCRFEQQLHEYTSKGVQFGIVICVRMIKLMHMVKQF